MSWNPVLNIIKEIKYKYNNKFNDNVMNLETWIKKLDLKEYNDIFDCLQINQDGNFVLIRYGLAEMQKGMWEDEKSIYRECRSVVIDLDKEELVITPFRKFFNLNEVEENKLEKVVKKLKSANLFEISDKLDGSMQCARWYDNRIVMTGSMALNMETSWRLTEGYSMLTSNHKCMLSENQDLTFIFEYISVKDAHVVLYDKSQEGLYLIGARNVKTGHHYSYAELTEFGLKYDISTVELENLSLDSILTKMKEYKAHEKEGWVINIDSHYIKIKCDDYVQLHRLLDKFSSVNVIIENIAENRIDDMISKVPDNYKDKISAISDKIIEWRDTTLKSIEEFYNASPKTDIKTFMIWVENNTPRAIRGYVRDKYKGKEFNVLKNGCSGYKKLKDLGIYDSYSALFSDMEV